MKYIFNPDYKLLNDKGRVMLMSKSEYFPPSYGGVSQFESFIHPIYAVVLSFFNGTEIKDGIDNAAKYLGVEPDTVKSFISKLIKNENIIVSKFQSISMFFPPNTIIEFSDNMKPGILSPLMFTINEKVDLRPKRHILPRSISLFLTPTCYTDCIYCLADRNKDTHTNFLRPERICEIIEEARKLDVNSFDITGGEVFLYPHWELIVEKLINCGFPPYISTKYPIGDDIVMKLKYLGINEIQVSIDTLIEPTIIKMVRPKSRNKYVEMMKNSLRALESYDIKVCIHTIVTSNNDSIADMESIYNYIRTLNNISSWRIDEAFYSRYAKEDWNKIRTSFKNMNTIYEYTQTITKDININIDDEYEYESVQFKNKEVFLKKGVRCPANYSSFGILSDGKVTSCSRFFWTPQFLIGDVRNKSIEEVWNSKEALDLWNKKKMNKLSVSKSESKCYSCERLDLCIDASRVCWSEIVDINGIDKWDYPDLQCPDSDKKKTNEFILSND